MDAVAPGATARDSDRCIDMKLIEAWRLQQETDLFPVEDPTEHLIQGFSRFVTYYNNIRRYGDAALAEYLAVDGLGIDDVILPVELFDEENDEDFLPENLDEQYLAAVDQAITRIINFYQHQKIQSWYVTGENDEIVGQQLNPIERVAVLMPRGWKFAPITLMMSIVPAIIAGVKDLYINLPPHMDEDGQAEPVDALFLWICDKLGISQIFRLPELPAIFAFSLGTSRVPRVDKIVGAGSEDVQAAAALVSTSVGVKVLPDRNETVILADASANESYIVADIFAVAEDPSLNKIIILTTSTVKATEISAEISRKINENPQAKRIKEILTTSGAIVLVKDIDEALNFIGRYPPKHLSLFVEHPMELLARVRDAGVLYMGEHTPAGMENYFASASNLIPSGRCCRFSSPLDVYDFLKKTSIVHYSKRQVVQVYEMINTLADKDNLPFHHESFRIRMQDNGGGFKR